MGDEILLQLRQKEASRRHLSGHLTRRVKYINFVGSILSLHHQFMNILLPSSGHTAWVSAKIENLREERGFLGDLRSQNREQLRTIREDIVRYMD